MGEGADRIARPELRAELLRRLELDQAARRAATRWEEGALDNLVRVDRENSGWLAGVLDEHGWPGRKLVGDDGGRAAWLLAQHADQDPSLQRRCLDLLSEAVAQGDASAANLAYLTDRVQLRELGYQTYGTQYEAAGGAWALRTVHDPGALEERRLSAGLPPLADQDRAMRETYGSPKVHISQRPVFVRCQNCGSPMPGERPKVGEDTKVICSTCGAERTRRTD